MSIEKQIEEMVEIIKPFVSGLACEEESGTCEFVNCQCCRAREIAMKIYNADFRKIYDDHHKQVACYTLGCQEGDKIARQVAAEIFAEIEKIIDNHYNRHIFGGEDLSDVEQEAVVNFSDDVTYDIAELKKKYTKQQ